MEEAQKVKKIYDELRKIKGEFVKQKNAVTSKKDEYDDSWTGNLHDTKFVTPGWTYWSVRYIVKQYKWMD